jgi:hypothetical protein
LQQLVVADVARILLMLVVETDCDCQRCAVEKPRWLVYHLCLYLSPSLSPFPCPFLDNDLHLPGTVVMAVCHGHRHDVYHVLPDIVLCHRLVSDLCLCHGIDPEGHLFDGLDHQPDIIWVYGLCLDRRGGILLRIYTSVDVYPRLLIYFSYALCLESGNESDASSYPSLQFGIRSNSQRSL